MGEIPSKQRIRDFVHKLSKYSPVFYIVVILSLATFQLDIFKDNVPKEFIIDSIIVISVFALGSIAVDKLLSKKDPKPFIYCPECDDAKMRPTGMWVCENCKQEFGKPRTEEKNSDNKK